MKRFNQLDDHKDDVVISGISGRFPESDDMEEFWTNLIHGVDMVTEDLGRRRSHTGLIDGVPTRKGLLKAEVTKFDAAFFGIHPKQAERMDPQFRMLHEVTWEAIMDAGVNPVTLRGSRVGVFVGAAQTQTLNASLKSSNFTSPYDTTGNFGSMAANRISYAFDFKGPSYTVDTLCSSSMLALHNAFKAIGNGECDAAIVGGVSLNLHPGITLQVMKSGALAPDGKCKSYDAGANGYVRSEAIVAVFIQRKNDARRVYATFIGSGTNSDGFTTSGISSPSEDAQKNLMHKIYLEKAIDVNRIFYIEGHGTGTVAGDMAELSAISEVVLSRRDKNLPPVLIGSVKSNMGHSEAASGLCSIAKVLLALQHKVLPANLHFKKPNPGISALLDGRLKVVAQNLDMNQDREGMEAGLIAMNSFGFGGSNVHVVLEPFSDSGSKISEADNDMARSNDSLILFSGVTEESVRFALEKIQVAEPDPHFESLLHEVVKYPVSGHRFRGYTVGRGDISIQEVPEPMNLWYIFSGMGTVYRGMFDDLLDIPTFAASIDECNKILTKFNINVLELSRGPDDVLINQNMGVLYAAMQIGLLDTMEALGLRPDGIIGHSAGELSCAYADKCLTREEVLCIFHHKDVCVLGCSGGSMAAVGMSWEETHIRCPEGVYPACHNDEKSVTIAGPFEAVTNFVEALKQEGIFARMIDTGGVAYHSPCLNPILPAYEAEVRQVFGNKVGGLKKRSKTWISTCVPKGKETEPEFETVSVKYLMSNIRDPVQFYTATRKIPSGVTVLEISSHSLFSSMLRKSRPDLGHVLGLIRRGNGNSRNQILNAMGKLYQLGWNPNVKALHKACSFPVPLCTRMIGPLIKWNHSRTFELMDYGFPALSAETRIAIDVNKEEYSYVKGHRIGGRVLFPAAGYLELAWAKFATMRGQQMETMPVEFNDVRFEHPTIIREDGRVMVPVAIDVSIASRNGGTFHFTTPEGHVLVKGEIKCLDSNHSNPENMQMESNKIQNVPQVEDVCLTSEDVYKLLRLAGYEYSGLFQGIHSVNFGRNTSKVVWNKNWTSFLDTVLQVYVLGEEDVCVKVPTGIHKLTIDPQQFLQHVKENLAALTFDPKLCLTTCPGIHIQKMKLSAIPRRIDKTKPVLEELRFISYFEPEPHLNNVEHAVKFFTDLVIENSPGNRIRVLENVDRVQNSLAPTILKWIRCQPLKEPEITLNAPLDAANAEVETWIQENCAGIGIQLNAKNGNGNSSNNNSFEKLNLFVTNSVVDLTSVYGTNLSILGPRFILLHTDQTPTAIVTLPNYTRVAEKLIGKNRFILYAKKLDSKTPPIVVHVQNKSLSWIKELQAAILEINSAPVEDNRRIYIVASGQQFTGITGFINCLRHEPDGRHVRCIASLKPLPPYTPESPNAMYKHVFEGDLIMNLFDSAGHLGSYRHFPLDPMKRDGLVDVQSAFVNYETKGDLSTLKFFESPPPLPVDKPRLCQVAHAALNFRDVMLATGKLQDDAIPGAGAGAMQDCLLGLEFSGWNQDHRRVMGMLPSLGLATHVVSHPIFTWSLPDTWSLEEAATVPVAYCTAYYALVMRGGIRCGESVLIHSGSGGVGQAAIAIALSMNCTVFTTVGSDSKRRFLLTRFPTLDPNNMSSSRDTHFERLVQERTNGHGVDLVLNSLAEEKLDASLRCLARGGRFLEIGKYDLSRNRALGMEIFLRNISVHGILLDSLFYEPGDQSCIRDLVQKGIDSGVVKPLPSTVFPRDEVESAFRFMASGKHIGKVLVQMRSEKDEDCSEPISMKAVGRMYFDPSKMYVIIGGLGGFGFELGRWMVEQRGCKKLALVSRPGSGVKNGYQAWLIRCWSRAGIWVHVAQADLTTLEGAEILIKELLEYGQGPIGGIFNSAMVLRDKQFTNQIEENFQAVLKPKVDTTINLDRLTRQPELFPSGGVDHFVVFSSFSAGRGVFGQTNYGWANAAMERICEERRRDGLSGLAIQWGAIGDVGVVYDQMGGNDRNLYGLEPQKLNSCLSAFEVLIRTASSSPVVTSCVLSTPKSAISAASESGQATANDNTPGIISMVCRIIGLSEPPSNRKLCLIDHGLDSLMAVEAQQVLESYFNIQLSADEIRRLSWEEMTRMETEKKMSSVDRTTG